MITHHSSTTPAWKKGQCGRLVRIHDPRVASRLAVMGILPGSRVCVMQVKAWHSGYYLKMDGRNIALRAREAAALEIEF